MMTEINLAVPCKKKKKKKKKNNVFGEALEERLKTGAQVLCFPHTELVAILKRNNLQTPKIHFPVLRFKRTLKDIKFYVC